jgi:alanine--tRNA ligase
MNSFEIREKFLKFFKNHGHTIVSSSSLIPAQDPTLLFTNAGMNQFKDVFLGLEKRSYTRAVSSQKCVRAGGKHNDLDEVGFTNRHLTFFEMLGNFSFGDYFKKEAITFAWDFLTKEMHFDTKNLSVSVYKTDDESYDLWAEMIGVPKERIFRFGEKENFWQMGDTGPCGPCTEIHVDRGVTMGCLKKECDPSCSCGRYVEVWNLVFMQYDRQSDGTLKPLAKTGVDTGMGLERLCMITQKKNSVFETDLFSYLTERIEKLIGRSYADASVELKAAFHVLGDHVRSSSLLIADGCSPSNDGRGYVLRKIIRRAALFAKKLGADVSLLPKLAETFIDTMAPVFSNVKESRTLVISVLKSEVERFATSLEQGEVIFEKYVEQSVGKKVISGEQVFKLYDTYGFPPELTRVLALDHGFTIDMVNFEKEMERQRAQSGSDKSEKKDELVFPPHIQTKFVGYDVLESKSKVTFVQQEGDYLWVVTEESPFYVESGGQLGDTGWMIIGETNYPVEKFLKVGRDENIVIAAKIKAKSVKVGDIAHCVVDLYKRSSTAKNHTATHLLQAALVQVVGKEVKQAGSLVSDEYLRFDFSYYQALTKHQLDQVELLVNQKIQEDHTLKIFSTSLAKATEAGVTAFFGEKYNPEKVRVVQVAGFSAELCGGSHVSKTGEIGCFKIVAETALATGTRRIIAVTGVAATKLFNDVFIRQRRLVSYIRLSLKRCMLLL